MTTYFLLHIYLCICVLYKYVYIDQSVLSMYLFAKKKFIYRRNGDVQK